VAKDQSINARPAPMMGTLVALQIIQASVYLGATVASEPHRLPVNLQMSLEILPSAQDLAAYRAAKMLG
jgi:hypothetical protein